ncbi:DUF1801 domain-containing protein [Flavisolibacter sp. BT320]|nr:DUF1801 domain-containing protein [Flavisolibacter longurius]
MNPQVTDYIQNAPEEQKAIMESLRELIYQQVPFVQESFKWSRPVFSINKDIAYFKTAKSYVTFGFMQAEKIKENLHLLEGTGKDMRHIKIKKVSEIDAELLTGWLKSMVDQ